MKRRYYFMDVLNIIATMAVIFLHTSEFAFNYEPTLRWGVAVVIQIAFIWAVPIFFMISGANLLNYRERYDTKTFFKKRLGKVLVPFLAWSLIWYIFNHFYFLNHDWGIRNFFDLLMHGQIQAVFWFFYFIIPFYFAVPFLSLITTRENKKTVLYVIAWFVLGVGIVGYTHSLRATPLDSFFSNMPLIMSTGIGFFFAGWYLQQFPPAKSQKKWYALGSMLAFLFMLGLTVYMSHQAGKTINAVYSILSIGGFFLPLGIWVYVRDALENWEPSPKMATWLKRLSGASLGVYVIHEFIIYIAENTYHLQAGSWWHMIVFPWFVWGLSIAITLALQKIPAINRLMP